MIHTLAFSGSLIVCVPHFGQNPLESNPFPPCKHHQEGIQRLRDGNTGNQGGRPENPESKPSPIQK